MLSQSVCRQGPGRRAEPQQAGAAQSVDAGCPGLIAGWKPVNGAAMRTLAFCTVMLAAALTSRDASGHIAWCANNYDRSNLECRFYTWDQCRAYVSGGIGDCMPNPYLAAWFAHPHKRFRRGRR